MRKQGRDKNVERAEKVSVIAKELLGHPVLVFTIHNSSCSPRGLLSTHCGLFVKRPGWHSLSYYTAAPTHEHRKKPWCMWVRLRGWAERVKNYSMIYTSKPLEGYAHPDEYYTGIYWCGKGAGRWLVYVFRSYCQCLNHLGCFSFIYFSHFWHRLAI